MYSHKKDNSMSQKYFVCKFFCWLEMWTLWRCVSNWRGLHHPNMPKDWLCGWLHGRRSSPLGDGSQGCSPGGSQLCPGTQDRFSLFYEAPRIDVGRAGRASAHLQSGLRLSSPGPSPARGHAWCSVLPGDSSHCSQARAHQGQAQGSGQWESGDKAREIKDQGVINLDTRWWLIRTSMGWRNQLTLCTGTELTL